jgi:hypothetical protein
MAELVLITRQGCCLCQGLEEKLAALALPLVRLEVDADPVLLARFDLEVPVLVLRDGAAERVLPRVSPRLAGPQLRSWLGAQGVSLD